MPLLNKAIIAIADVAVSFMVFGNAIAASFDCANAVTSRQKTVCGSPNLSDLDEKLAEAYKDALTASQDPAQIKTKQIEWLKEAGKCQSDSNCIERLYAARISELNPRSVKLTPEPAAATPVPIAPVEQRDIVPQPAASAAVLSASTAEVELPVTPASAASQAETQAQVASAPIVENADTMTSVFSNETYQRYALIAVGGIFSAIALFYLLRFFISLAKKGSAVISKKGLELKQNVAQGTIKAKETITEKATEMAADISARTNVAASVASIKMKKVLNETTEKSAPHLQTLKADLADMRSKDGLKNPFTKALPGH